VDVVNVCIVPSLPFRIWGRRKHPRSGSARSIALEVGRNDRPTRTNSGSPKWLFTTDKPVIIAHHGYPMLIHRLTYRRTNHRNIHVRGYKEEGTTTPFDMVVRNDLDRFHLASDVIDRVPKLGYMAAYAKQALRDKLIEHKQYITRHGDDMPEVKDWRWPAARLRGRGKSKASCLVSPDARRRPSGATVFEAEAASSRLDDQPSRAPIMIWFGPG